MPTNADSQVQSGEFTPARRTTTLGSRSSSMQADAGDTEQQTAVANFKPTAKRPSDMSYSMDRWLNQKPSEESWHGVRG
jgi:hypothetical protein